MFFELCVSSVFPMRELYNDEEKYAKETYNKLKNHSDVFVENNKVKIKIDTLEDLICFANECKQKRIVIEHDAECGWVLEDYDDYRE